MNNLTMDEMKYVQDELRLKGKKLSISYILLIFLGFLGLHLAYLEKTKLAIIRALLTVSTIATFFPIRSAVLTSEINGVTMELQQYSSALLVVYSILVLTAIFWQLYDLFSLPSMVTKVNNKIEEKASQDAIMSRNLEGLLVENEVADRMIERVSEKITSEIDNKIKEVKDKALSIQEDIKIKNDETLLMLNSLKENYSEIDNIIKNKELIKDDKIEKLSSKSNDENDFDEAQKKENAVTKSHEIKVENENKTEQMENEGQIETESNKLKEDEKSEEHSDIEQDNIVIESKDVTSYEELTQEEPIKESKVNKSTIKNESASKDDSSDNSTKEDIIENHNFSVANNEKESPEEKVINEEIKENYLTVAEAKEKGKGKHSIIGFIVGTMSPKINDVITENFDNDLNILIAEDENEEDRNKMLAVQLSKNSKLKRKAGLQTNPSNLGKKVIVSGSIENYFKGLGVKKVNSIKFVNEE